LKARAISQEATRKVNIELPEKGKYIMAVVGIDLGSQNTKAVILEGDEILGGASMETGESAETEARMTVQEALKKTGLKREDLKAAVATGPLSVPVTKAVNITGLTQRSAASCIALGAYFRFPQARTVLYVGADSSMAIRMSADGQVEDSVKNERCAVSSGALLDIVSRMLEIPMEDMGELSLKSTNPQTVSSRCVVFAEGEILSFIHKDPPVPISDVLAGVNKSIADGLWSMVQKVGVPSELLLCGGVIRNVGIVKAIEAHLGKPALVPKQPQYVRALGAAVFARQLLQQGGV
jgi:predicted CoA-substrate-specific enzyme activase